MSKDQPTFDQVLSRSIELWYESDSDFARQATVSSSAVSRWVAGAQIPKPATIERIAPWVRDDEGRPYPARLLLDIAYPTLRFAAEVSSPPAVAIHPLAREIGRMLAEDSPIPPDKRERLSLLLESVIEPYRPQMRRRKAG